LEEKVEMSLRCGVGHTMPWNELNESYKEAAKALDIGLGSVTHAADLLMGVQWEETYPIDLERQIFASIDEGDTEKTRKLAEKFFRWMTDTYPGKVEDIRLKVLDFVLRAEKTSYEKGGATYRFGSGTDYLNTVCTSDEKTLGQWFEDKMVLSASEVNSARDKVLKSPVKKAIDYIKDNYSKDLSLDQISRMVDVSPYYFSKLFKKEEGVGFIDYLTNLRIEKAKEMLMDDTKSIRDVCTLVGYQDPNYFSRIFKKMTGTTPTEYKEGIGRI
ncbi:MAG: AraC family transcriptional regulator, partial [Lachnospiraceae bacterium]|nr:AraC family transcriptional regulator [Lachnospiraceae bacterium]